MVFSQIILESIKFVGFAVGGLLLFNSYFIADSSTNFMRGFIEIICRQKVLPTPSTIGGHRS